MSGPDEQNSEIRDFGFRAPRFPVNFHFSFQVVATGAQLDGNCTDLSEDGLAAELAESLPPKTEVTLWLLLPGGTVPLRIRASVGYQEKKRTGFTFQYASADERAQVKAYLDSLKPKTLHVRGQD